MKNLLIASVMATLIALVSTTHASPGLGKHGSELTEAEKAEYMQARLDRMATKLGLSDEQKIQMQELKQTSSNEIKPLFIEKRALEKEIRELDTSASDYSEKLADVANRKAELSRQITIATGMQRQEMASILTEEQLALKNEMKKKRKGKRSQ